MKKRRLVSADSYAVSDSGATFSSASAQTASIFLSDSGLCVNIQGSDDFLSIRKAGILERPNWLALGFGLEARLSRLVIEFSSVELADVYRDLRGLFGRADISCRRAPSDSNK